MGRGWFLAHVVYEVGEGTCIRFWYDPWSGRLPLKDLYPDLFECAADKEDLIFDVLVYPSRSWNLWLNRGGRGAFFF